MCAWEREKEKETKKTLSFEQCTTTAESTYACVFFKNHSLDYLLSSLGCLSLLVIGWIKDAVHRNLRKSAHWEQCTSATTLLMHFIRHTKSIHTKFNLKSNNDCQCNSTKRFYCCLQWWRCGYVMMTMNTGSHVSVCRIQYGNSVFLLCTLLSTNRTVF